MSVVVERFRQALMAPDASGGAIFEWAFDSDAFRLRFHEIGAWLETATHLVRERAFTALDVRPGYALADDDRWRELGAARLRADAGAR